MTMRRSSQWKIMKCEIASSWRTAPTRIECRVRCVNQDGLSNEFDQRQGDPVAVEPRPKDEQHATDSATSVMAAIGSTTALSIVPADARLAVCRGA